jgi:hypothetical protein
MLIELLRTFVAGPIRLERAIASRLHFGLSAHRSDAPHGLHLDDLRAQLDHAEGRVAESERLVAGWQELLESERAAGRDVSWARDLLSTFQKSLNVTISDRETADRAVAQRLVDLFAGVRGRLPENDQELQTWLASPAGKAATAFELTSLSPCGERGRS